MKAYANQLNKLLFGLGTIVGFVLAAYLANFFVAEFFGGVNPLVEFSSIPMTQIQPADRATREELTGAFEACKQDLTNSSVDYEFPDSSYQAWNLDEGRLLIQSRVYANDDGSSRAVNFTCRVLKSDSEYLASRWTVQGIQVSLL